MSNTIRTIRQKELRDITPWLDWAKAQWEEKMLEADAGLSALQLQAASDPNPPPDLDRRLAQAKRKVTILKKTREQMIRRLATKKAWQESAGFPSKVLAATRPCSSRSIDPRQLAFLAKGVEKSDVEGYDNVATAKRRCELTHRLATAESPCGPFTRTQLVKLGLWYRRPARELAWVDWGRNKSETEARCKRYYAALGRQPLTKVAQALIDLGYDLLTLNPKVYDLVAEGLEKWQRMAREYHPEVPRKVWYEPFLKQMAKEVAESGLPLVDPRVRVRGYGLDGRTHPAKLTVV